jgi:hypothetical protein
MLYSNYSLGIKTNRKVLFWRDWYWTMPFVKLYNETSFYFFISIAQNEILWTV